MFMYRFLSINELIFSGCSEAEVIFLGCLKISWTDPPVCVCAECPPGALSFRCSYLIGNIFSLFSEKKTMLLCSTGTTLWWIKILPVHPRGVPLSQKGLRDFVRTNRFLQTFDGFLSKQKDSCQKCTRFFGSEMPIGVNEALHSTI